MTSLPRELFDKGLISEDQFLKLDAIYSGKILSVFYELRSLLYLGILLFTTGVGILIYQNIGELGHVIAIIVLTLLTLACFWHAFTKGPPYSKKEVKGPTPYFDYIVLLGSLLFISVLGYFQYQFGIFGERLDLVTLFTSIFFFYAAYRFDHAGVLSLAITALASFWSLSISPQKWYQGKFDYTTDLNVTAIIFGASLSAWALFLDYKSIKRHFTFTYVNFGTLLFFFGAMAGLFDGHTTVLYALLIYGGCVFAWFMARTKMSFMFLLYAFVAAYIATTYLLSIVMDDDFFGFWYYYSILSCGGFIFFIIRYRTYFKRKE